MGAEAACRLTVGRRKDEGKALLETDALMFRGADMRLSIPYAAIESVESKDGRLRVTYSDGTASFELGAMAAKWADKIRNPPSRADKLGVRSGQRVVMVGFADEALVIELEARGAKVAKRLAANTNVIFFAADERSKLAKLTSLKSYLPPDGALWIVRPKGVAAITETDVIKAGKAAGLVDVKVVRYSDTHTAEKYVIPVRQR